MLETLHGNDNPQDPKPGLLKSGEDLARDLKQTRRSRPPRRTPPPLPTERKRHAGSADRALACARGPVAALRSDVGERRALRRRPWRGGISPWRGGVRGALLGALVEVVQPRHRVPLQALAQVGVLRAVVGGEHLVDQLGAGAELLLHLGEDGVEPEQLGVRDVLEPPVVAAVGAGAADPQLLRGEGLEGLHQLRLVAELVLHGRERALHPGLLRRVREMTRAAMGRAS